MDGTQVLESLIAEELTPPTETELMTAEDEVRASIPAHLDADELIANSWNNASNVPPNEWVSVFRATAAEYINQNCSSY